MKTKTPTTPVTTIKGAPAMNPALINVAEIDSGHIFSEASHYEFTGKKKPDGLMEFRQLENNTNVFLTPDYVAKFLQTADQFVTEIMVGKEDKLWTQKQLDDLVKDNPAYATDLPRVGDVRVRGIRTIFEEIHNSHVFTVCYETQSKELSKKEYEARIKVKGEEFLAKLDAVKKAKKGVSAEAVALFQEYQENPVSKYEMGTDRVLRGYKVQFVSRDGRYNCIDVDIKEVHNIRPVNINTIKWLVFNGIRYVVE